FSSRRRHTRSTRDWSSDVCSSDLLPNTGCVTAGNHAQACGTAKIAVFGRCVLGYPDPTNTPRSSTVFSESTVLGAFSVFGSGLRSEERRVGKERGSGCVQWHKMKE